MYIPNPNPPSVATRKPNPNCVETAVGMILAAGTGQDYHGALMPLDRTTT